MILAWRSNLSYGLASILVVASSFQTSAQNPAAQPAVPPSKALVIPDEPRGIDPAALLPAKLAANARADFKETPLSEIVRWLQAEQKLGVILDQGPLAKDDILPSEPITERLDNSPLYLLLDRLRSYRIGWYQEDGLVHITSLEDAESKLRTVPYNVGDLIDQGFKTEELLSTILSTIAPASWNEVGGPANIVELGDVLFVSQSPQEHLQVAGLLQALRKHGRRTYTYDPPANEKVRAALDRPVSLQVQDQALSSVLAQLSTAAGVDIRLDRSSTTPSRARETQPVSLAIENQKLRVVLRVLLEKLDLTSAIRDGVIWVGSPDESDDYYKTAVYDVRDLCRDDGEAAALKDAVENQMGGVLDSSGGAGSMEFPLPGAMVVYLKEQDHNRLLDLLESYRAALRVSKPRPRAGDDPKEVITRYYRLPSAMASDVAAVLPKLIKEATWQADNRRDAPGTILLLASKAKLEAAAEAKEAGKAPSGSAVVIPYSVLVIKQYREVHDALPDLLYKLQEGDAPIGGAFGGNGMGGMGGFGGGFFSVPGK